MDEHTPGDDLPGEPPFEPARTLDAVRAAWNAAESPTEWFHNEIVEYFGDGAEDLKDSLEEREDELRGQQLPPDGILAFEVQVIAPDGAEKVLVLRNVPHPAELLWTVSQYADVDDIIVVTHHYRETHATVELEWPFGVNEAIVLTSPNAPEAYPKIVQEPDDDYPFEAMIDAAATIELQDTTELPVSRPEAAAALAGVVVGSAAVLAGVIVGAALRRR